MIDNIQKELFELEAPKKQPKNRFGQFFQKTDFAISLSAEKLVFISIGIIMLLVIFFALGVERGKVIAAGSMETTHATAQVSTLNVSGNAPAQQAAPVKTVNAATNIIPKEKAPAAQYPADKSKPYTIVAAAYSKEDSASKEVIKLKGSGLEAFLIKSDPYYLACVGSFANKDSAKTVLSKVRQAHKDAYVRLR